jgi:hypothetical protein
MLLRPRGSDGRASRKSAPNRKVPEIARRFPLTARGPTTSSAPVHRRINSMKIVLTAGALVAACIGFSSIAMAGADDAKWVAKCVSDNAGAKVSVEIISKYCTCMNNEMDNNETRSISTWEKTSDGKVAMAKCDKESGWDKK